MKRLRVIPYYNRKEAIYVPKPNVENIHSVPEGKWGQWNDAARDMFNHVYGAGKNNPDIIFALDKLKVARGGKIDKIVHAASWNMAWTAADKIMKQTT